MPPETNFCENIRPQILLSDGCSPESDSDDVEDIRKQGKKRYSCKYDGCSKDFQSRVRLNGHVAQVHTKLLPFECPEEGCNECFAMQIYLNRHQKRHKLAQEGVKCRRNFSCSECDEKFDRKWMLRSHQHHVHGETPTHQCTVCKKVFYIKYKLEKHYRKVHEKPIRKCNFIECNFTTNKWSIYRKHIAEHNLHKKCQFCDKIFSTTSNCRSHEQESHFHELKTDNSLATIDISLPKLFSCEYAGCDKSYYRRSNLNQHVKSAHQPPTFKCTICSKMFALKHVLKHHVKNVHSETKKKNNKIDIRMESVDQEKLNLVKNLTTKKEINRFLGKDEDEDCDTDLNAPALQNDKLAILCAIAKSSLV